MSRPLLLGCNAIYLGPWVPTSGLKGELSVQGMCPILDEVVIRIRDTTEREEDTVITVERDMSMKVDLKHSLIRAERTKSTGAEVYVWLK